MFNLANILTSGNLMAGILAVIFALQGDLLLAAYLIFTGAIFDFLDGFAARLFKTSGDLGKQLDSLADMITFGVAPGVIIMVLLTIDYSVVDQSDPAQISVQFDNWFETMKMGGVNFLPFSGLLFPFFALFRLAKFNIDTRQSTSFIGLPTPAGTLFFTTFPLVLFNSSIDGVAWMFNPWLIVGLTLIIGLLMISEIPLFSLKFKQFNWKGNEIRFVFLLISLILIPVFSFWSIALIVFLYLILSIIENILEKSKRNEV